METRNFHLGDILTVTTGCLVSPRKIEGVYDILNFMTQDDIYTHQIPRAMKECKPNLLKQHPQLSDVDASKVTPKNWQQWLSEQVAKFGGYLPVQQLPETDHLVKNPVEELVEMVGPKKVFVIET